MKLRLNMLIAAILSLAGSTGPIGAQGFSCSMGQPACLDYGAVVCKSMAKCVGRDAICFDSYECDYEGFVCKSKMDDVVDEYDVLLKKAKGLQSSLISADDELSRLKACVGYATTLQEAQNC